MDTANNLYDVFAGVSVASNGLLGAMILVIVFIITFASTVREGAVSALVTSSLLTTVVSVILLGIGLVSWQVTLIPIMLLFVSLIMKFFQR